MNEYNILQQTGGYVILLLQATVILMALLAYGHKNIDRYSWRWFIVASIIVFLRRITHMVELSWDFNVELIEFVETLLISVAWIFYVWRRTCGFTNEKRKPVSEDRFC